MLLMKCQAVFNVFLLICNLLQILLSFNKSLMLL